MRCPAVAAALALLLPVAAHASPVGEWTTEGGKARVRIDACAADPQQLCGLITWSYRPPDVPAGPLVDVNNQDPALQTRPILGLPLLQGFSPDGDDRWSGGTIYDPENGKTYRSKLRLRSPDQLEVDGCILFLCQSQVWDRYRG